LREPHQNESTLKGLGGVTPGALLFFDTGNCFLKFLLPFGEKVRMRGRTQLNTPPHPGPLPKGEREAASNPPLKSLGNEEKSC